MLAKATWQMPAGDQMGEHFRLFHVGKSLDALELYFSLDLVWSHLSIPLWSRASLCWAPLFSPAGRRRPHPQHIRNLV